MARCAWPPSEVAAPLPGLDGRKVHDPDSCLSLGGGRRASLAATPAFDQNVPIDTESVAVQRVVSESSQEVGPNSLDQLSQKLAGGGKCAAILLSITLISPMDLFRDSTASLPKLALGAAVALAAISLSPGSAHALVVTVGGVQYDVTTFTGSYNGSTSKFAIAASGGVMPWWGSDSLAATFSDVVGLSLGDPFNFIVGNNWGPYFAYRLVNGGNDGVGAAAYFMNPPIFGPGSYLIGSQAQGPSLDSSAVWAQATQVQVPASVPGPLPLFGAAAAFGFSRKLRKRIKLAPAALGTSLPLA